MKTVLAFFFFLFIFCSGYAQVEPLLVLKKPGTKHRINYFVGSDIVFKLYDEEQYNYGIITAITDSAVYINRIMFEYNSIKAIADKSKVGLFRGFSLNALYAIPIVVLPGLLLSDTKNNTSKNIIDRPVIFLSTVFGGIAVARQLYNGKRYRLNKRWQLVPVIM